MQARPMTAHCPLVYKSTLIHYITALSDTCCSEFVLYEHSSSIRHLQNPSTILTYLTWYYNKSVLHHFHTAYDYTPDQLYIVYALYSHNYFKNSILAA